MHYLDHAATSPLRPEAQAAWLAAAETGGNPSSTHRAGQRARQLLEEAREEVAACLGAHPSEVIFTSGGTEADNLALSGAGTAVVSAIEHPAVLEAARAAAQQPLRTVPVGPGGTADLAELARLARGADLISLMWVNNETGIRQPIPQLVEIAHRHGALAHSDAVQAIGTETVNFAESGLDLLSISGHKLGAPVGVGALLRRRGVKLRPTSWGGGQEGGVRSGTSNVPGACALAASCAVVTEKRQEEAARLSELREVAAAALARAGAHLTPPGAPHILHATVPGAHSEPLLFALDRQSIAASAGSACRAGVHQPSHVILAMGRGEEAARSTLRVSLGWSTTRADVDAFAAALPEAVRRAQAATAATRR